MNKENYTTTIRVNQSPELVFNAINHVRGWWSEQIEGKTDALNEVFSYHYKDVHRCRIKIIYFVANKKVVWLVEDNYFDFIKDQSEWKDTRISFEISKRGDQTELAFTHIGLVPADKCYNICSDSWSNYIQGSLKNLIEQGEGKPNPYQTAVVSARNLKDKAESTNYTTSFLIESAPATVFNAINDVSKWWSTNFHGKSTSVGDEFEVSFADIHYSRHRILEFEPYKRIVWLVTDSKLNFVEEQDEWTGTRNIFEIVPENGKTRITFTHLGLGPKLSCFSNCVNGWNEYMGGSLLPFILDGKGSPWK